jgi:hypothetical protein
MLKRFETLPFNQVTNDCLVKTHAKLLSNYFCNMLRIMDPLIIGRMSIKFNKLLSNYSVNEIDETTGKKTTVKGYGGYLTDVIGRIHNRNKKYLSPFIKSQVDAINHLNFQPPDVMTEDNVDDANGNILPPGSQNVIIAIDQFMHGINRYPSDNRKFITSFAIEILLTPCFFYWLARLDNAPHENTPDPILMMCIRQELATVSWDGEKYVSIPDSNADILRAYLVSIGEDPLEADRYKEYPGHSVLIKGFDPGMNCFLVQNSWGLPWNAHFCGARPISREVINIVSYGAIMITPDVHGFGAGFKRKRQPKTNKNKKKPKSPKKGTRKRK